MLVCLSVCAFLCLSMYISIAGVYMYICMYVCRCTVCESLSAWSCVCPFTCMTECPSSSQATEISSTERSATAIIDLTIADLNDNFPVFARQKYTMSVTENTRVNETLLTVTAVDIDGVRGWGGITVCVAVISDVGGWSGHQMHVWSDRVGKDKLAYVRIWETSTCVESRL